MTRRCRLVWVSGPVRLMCLEGEGGKSKDLANYVGQTLASVETPEFLVVMIGDHDVARDRSPEEISSHILACVSLIQGARVGVANIVLCQLMPLFESRRALCRLP